MAQWQSEFYSFGHTSTRSQAAHGDFKTAAWCECLNSSIIKETLLWTYIDYGREHMNANIKAGGLVKLLWQCQLKSSSDSNSTASESKENLKKLKWNSSWVDQWLWQWQKLLKLISSQIVLLVAFIAAACAAPAPKPKPDPYVVAAVPSVYDAYSPYAYSNYYSYPSVYSPYYSGEYLKTKVEPFRFITQCLIIKQDTRDTPTLDMLTTNSLLFPQLHKLEPFEVSLNVLWIRKKTSVNKAGRKFRSEKAQCSIIVGLFKCSKFFLFLLSWINYITFRIFLLGSDIHGYFSSTNLSLKANKNVSSTIK